MIKTANRKKRSETANNETQKLQEQLKSLLKEVGWTRKELAVNITSSEEYRSQDKEDPDKEYERLRKALNRASTKPATLHCYINFILEENKKRELYKLPKPDIHNFSASEQKILKEVGEIAFNFFQHENGQ